MYTQFNKMPATQGPQGLDGPQGPRGATGPAVTFTDEMVNGDFEVKGSLISTMNGTNDDPFCMPYPQGPHAVQRTSFAKVGIQVTTGAPWSETLCEGTMFDPLLPRESNGNPITESSSYIHAVPLNDSSYNFDSSGVKFPGNFYFKDPLTQLIPCSAPIRSVCTAFIPVKGSKTKSPLFTTSTNAGQCNLDDYLLSRLWKNNSLMESSMGMDDDIGPKSLYQLFKAFDFTTIPGLNVTYKSTPGVTFLTVLQALQQSCTPGTPGTICTTLLKFVVSTKLNSATKASLYNFIKSSQNYINLTTFQNHSTYSPCSTEKENGIYKTTFDFSNILSNNLPIVYFAENLQDPIANHYMAEQLASYGMIVVCIGIVYNQSISFRYPGNTLTALELAQENKLFTWINDKVNYDLTIAINDTHLLTKRMGNLYTHYAVLFNAKRSHSEWNLGSLDTAKDCALEYVNILKNLKSTASTGNLGDYVDWMNIGVNGYSGSTAIGAAFNELAVDPEYNEQFLCTAVRFGNGMALIPSGPNDINGFETVPQEWYDRCGIPQNCGPEIVGGTVDRWYPNGFNVSTFIEMPSANEYSRNPTNYYYGGSSIFRLSIGPAKFIQEAVHKTSIAPRANSIYVEGWARTHAGSLPDYMHRLKTFMFPCSSGLYLPTVGAPNYNDPLFKVSQMTKQEHQEYYGLIMDDTMIRYYRSQLTHDVSLEAVADNPFPTKICPWDIPMANDYSWPYQQYDMEVGGAGTFTVPYQKNEIQVLLTNKEQIFAMGTDTSGVNPVVTIGDTTGAYSNTTLKINGTIEMKDTSGVLQTLSGEQLKQLLALLV